MNVKRVKAFIATASNEELVATYKRLKAAQRHMGLSALVASCRVTDKLYREIKARKISLDTFQNL